MDKKCKCSSNNCDECFECGRYYSSHSPHYESYYKREVVNITCFFGEAGTYDPETRQRLSTI